MNRTFFQTRSWFTVHFGKMLPDCVSTMETFDGQIHQQSYDQRKKTIERYPFHHQDMVKKCLHQTTRVFLRERDPTLSSDGTVRRLILTPNPEFTMSLREPGSDNRSMPNDFFTQDNVELLQLPVSISSCGAQHVSGRIVRSCACWCER